MTWLELAKKYVVKDERYLKKQVVTSRIKNLIDRDHDYLLCIPCSRGSIYRYSDDGEWWAVYVTPSVRREFKRRAIWKKLEALNLEPIQIGDSEASWKFHISKMEEVASILRVHKRKKKKGGVL